MTTMYGITNCDTIKKARKWLQENQINYEFHDYKKLGAHTEVLNSAINKAGLDKVLNKRGTTYRKLSDDIKESINEQSAIALMAEHTSMIKRPILEHEGHILVGFDINDYCEVFGLA